MLTQRVSSRYLIVFTALFGTLLLAGTHAVAQGQTCQDVCEAAHAVCVEFCQFEPSPFFCERSCRQELLACSGDCQPPPTCDGLEATIVGTTVNDTLFGTAGNDVIVGGDGDDTIDGRGGNDVICGDSGDDRLFGGTGNDRLLGGAGKDTLFGNEGHDVLKGGTENDVLVGNAGDDALEGGTGHDVCDGSTGVDTGVTCEVNFDIP